MKSPDNGAVVCQCKNDRGFLPPLEGFWPCLLPSCLPCLCLVGSHGTSGRACVRLLSGGGVSPTNRLPPSSLSPPPRPIILAPWLPAWRQTELWLRLDSSVHGGEDRMRLRSLSGTARYCQVMFGPDIWFRITTSETEKEV